MSAEEHTQASSSSSSSSSSTSSSKAGKAVGYSVGATGEPRAIRRKKTVSKHGEQWEDPYAWIRDIEGQRDEVMGYLKAENAYTAEKLRHTEPLQQRLYEEFVGRTKLDDASVPIRRGKFEYYSREETGLQYKIRCRKPLGDEQQEEVVLDENKLAQGHDFMMLGSYSISDDGKLVAYSFDTAGSEDYELHVRDVASGKDLPDCVKNAYSSAVWASDNEHLFYTVLNEQHQPTKVFRHRLGTPADEDFLVYEEKDSEFWLGIGKTRSQQYILIELGSSETSEIHYIPSHQPTASPIVFHPREDGVMYEVAHFLIGEETGFFVLTNADGADDFQLMRCSLPDTARSEWELLVPHLPGNRLNDMDVFAKHLVLHSRSGALTQMDVVSLPLVKKTGSWLEWEHNRVEWSDEIFSYRALSTPEFHSDYIRAAYQSLVQPVTVYDIDLQSLQKQKRKEQEIPSGYNASEYRSKRMWVHSDDGDVDIPISIVWRADQQRVGIPGPLLLYGYGSYEVSIDPAFDVKRISLLDRGFTFAIAHVRGGGEMGRRWYLEGKYEHKPRSFDDFVLCAQALVDAKHTEPSQLVAIGRSAGGLLMGGVANLRPDLFTAMILDVPFVDVTNTMLDATIPLTVLEYQEWGCPEEKKYFDVMRSYSPLQNLHVAKSKYPRLFIQGGLNDKRVCYWEPAKYIATIRHTMRKNRQEDFLLKLDMGAGHFSKSGRFDKLREYAYEWAFILDAVNLAGPESARILLDHHQSSSTAHSPAAAETCPICLLNKSK